MNAEIEIFNLWAANLCILILFFPLSISLFYIFHFNIYTQNEYRQLYREHWNKPIFSDLLAISLGESCPDDFVPLTFGKTDHVLSKTVCTKTCYNGKTVSCCSSIESPEVDRMPYDNWRNTRFCYKPVKDNLNNQLNYYSSPVYASCPQNTVDCGIIDSANQHFCAATESECPIQDIQIVEGSSQIPSSYTRIPLKDDFHSLIYTRANPSLKIYSDLKITHGPLCSLYYERALTPDTFTTLALTTDFYNECATKLNGYKLNPNFIVIDKNVGLGMLEAMNYPYETILNFPIRRLEQFNDFHFQGGLYPGNKCFSEYSADLNSVVSQGFLSDFAHGSFNTALVMYCAAYPLYFLVCAICLAYILINDPDPRELKRFRIVGFIPQALFLLPMIIAFAYYGFKMYLHRGDKIITDIMGENIKSCFEPFDFANIEWINNQSSNDWMFELQAVLYIAHGFFFIGTIIKLNRIVS